MLLAGIFRQGILFYLVTGFALLLFPSTIMAGNGGEDEKGIGGPSSDTTQAIVLYGHNFLFDPSRFSSEIQLVEYLDSLLERDNIDRALINEISLFMEVRRKTDAEIYQMIDSLFDRDQVPYALINQINFYVATRDLGKNSRFNTPTVTAYFSSPSNKGHCFYEAWNTVNPHPVYNIEHEPDSSVTLVLADSLSFCNYHHPVPGVVTSNFGWRDGRAHNGIDLDLVTGDPVYSAFDGIVRLARRHGGYGNLVVVRHFNGLETYYAHLNRIKVKPGQSVEAGQVLGSGGNTGNSTGSHLHFEVRFRGKPINPKHVISFNEKELHSQKITINKARWSYSAYPAGVRVHEVKRGESLSLIANRYGTTISRICELNQISKRTVLRVGMKLRVTS